MKKLTIIGAFIMLFMLTSVGLMASEEKKIDEGDLKKSKEITWVKYDEGLKLAKEQGKHLIVNFTTAWCRYCKMMNKTTFKDEEIVNLISENYIAVKVWADSKNDLDVDGYKISEKDLSNKEYGVSGYPTYWFIKPDGEKFGQVSGFQEVDPFAEILFYMKEKLYDKITFDDFMKAGGRKGYNKG